MMEFVGEGITLQLTNHAVVQIAREVRRHRWTETGGLLIGTYSDNLHSVRVVQATGPGKYSIHAPFAFTRGVRDLQRMVERAEADGLYYVGEWHSHPGENMSPSIQDLRQMREISADSGYNCPEPVLLVVGSANPLERVSVHVFFGDKKIELRRGEIQ